MNLLIIEDEWLVAHFIADVALMQSIEVVGIAQSYDEAMEQIDKVHIDCAIVDINIKGPKHGIDVARILKSKNIPFFFLTAYKDMDTIHEATALKPLSYLIKPISEENLIAAFVLFKNLLNTLPPKPFPFSVDNNGTVLLEEKIIPLSVAERIVFAQLIKNRNNIVAHETFFALLWENPDEINGGTLRNIILKLRKQYNLKINNIKNMGYTLLE
ncbi:response regulator [Sulfuricurvum sp.]|uniref:response regulator n=1 Tax=Sulfuricurvum sp. TaxID=2025608 RepID=UPI002608E5E4|nr:response regulator [Sulfuricurvum sp.]MDD2781795.1 response regulator [Sulfuricurvum sp.]